MSSSSATNKKTLFYNQFLNKNVISYFFYHCNICMLCKLQVRTVKLLLDSDKKQTSAIKFAI